MTFFHRTDVKKSVSRAKFSDERARFVRNSPAPPKLIKNNKKPPKNVDFFIFLFFRIFEKNVHEYFPLYRPRRRRGKKLRIFSALPPRRRREKKLLKLNLFKIIQNLIFLTVSNAKI